MRVDGDSVTLAVSGCVRAHVRLVRLACTCASCGAKTVWSVASEGLAAVAQEEVVLLLEARDGETRVPPLVQHLVARIARSAATLAHLSCVPAPEGDESSGGGFLLVRASSVSCLPPQALLPPLAPFLVALPFHRTEAVWAQVLPLRLLLRMGVEARVFPAPGVGSRDRRPLFFEVGHTILNVLAVSHSCAHALTDSRSRQDLRNFAYAMPCVAGVVVTHCLASRRTTLLLPRTRYDAVAKATAQQREHVIALATSETSAPVPHLALSQSADSEEYETRVLARDGSCSSVAAAAAAASATCQEEEGVVVVAAAFVVLSGALKARADGASARASLVEDGVLVQLLPHLIDGVRLALRDMRDFEADDLVIRWIPSAPEAEVDCARSAVDGRRLPSHARLRLRASADAAGQPLRWTELFCLEGGSEAECARVASLVARALAPHVREGVKGVRALARVGVRISSGGRYEVGVDGRALALPALDDLLVPLASSSPPLELLFLFLPQLQQQHHVQ